MVNNMKLLICFLLVFLATSCAKESKVVIEPKTNTVTNLNIQKESHSEQKPLEKLANPSKQIKIPDVKDFDIQYLRRNSNQKDVSGWNLPPFENAEIGMGLSQEPKVGEKVTIVPLKVNIEPFQLLILNFDKQKNDGCDTGGVTRKFFWNVELEKITNKEILEIKPVKGDNQELPFEVFMINPAVEHAKNLPLEEISLQMIPKGVTVKTIEAAIDLNNDKTPDLLYVEFCCKNRNESLDNCDYNCIEWYKKIKGKWKLVDSANPC